MTLEEKKRLDKIIDEIVIESSYTEAEIKSLAIEQHTNLWANLPFMTENVNTASDTQLKKWMVNFVRHNLTSYDEALVQINDKLTGSYHIFKMSVLDKIACAYPFLKEECDRQKVEFYHRRW